MTPNSWTPERIRALREARGLTQEQLAQLLHVAFTTVNRWERGHTAPSWHVSRMLDDLAAETPGHTKKEQS